MKNSSIPSCDTAGEKVLQGVVVQSEDPRAAMAWALLEREEQGTADHPERQWEVHETEVQKRGDSEVSLNTILVSGLFAQFGAQSR